MVKLNVSLPRDGFESGPNMKLYPGGLNRDIVKLLDLAEFRSIPLETVWKKFPECKNITFIRHLESKYNEYKVLVRETDVYKEFAKLPNDSDKKYELSLDLLKHFRDNVGIDYQTDISEKGKEQGELYGRLYAEMIAVNPSLFPTIIVASPYLRTRLTTHYFLKYVKGLDLDIDSLLNSKKDMILGSFAGKDITLKLSDELRERDYGRDVAPQYLKDYFDSRNPLHHLGGMMEEDDTEMSYYTAPNGGESQVQVNQRIKLALNSIISDSHQNVLVISHHLAVLAALNTIFSGTINTFQNFDNNWKPENGSMTMLSQIPKTESGQKDKLRVSAYNVTLGK